MPGPRINKAGDNFWNFVAKNTEGCWDWQGCVDKRGRALLSINRKMVFAHRHAYELTRGPVPEGHELTRTCANPRCVRPDHIQAVTRSANASRGRHTDKTGDNFWKWITPTDDGCWEWQGYVSGGGYGRLKISGKYVSAHRYAYEMVRGQIADGLQLDHLCRNRRCVRPDHLEPVTPTVNQRRGLNCYTSGLRERCKHGHLLTPENVIRQGPHGRRQCRTCLRGARRRYDTSRRKSQPS